MITSLRMRNFKNFQDAELRLGPLTFLIGANASGKSNIRDAFRFLHGNARGYNLAEIIGEKYGEGGQPLWRGIRGGSREIVYQGEHEFSLEFSSDPAPGQNGQKYANLRYNLKIGVRDIEKPPLVLGEDLWSDGMTALRASPGNSLSTLNVVLNPEMQAGVRTTKELGDHSSALAQMTQHHLGDLLYDAVRKAMIRAVIECNNMRFLDLYPSAMRNASFPGQDILGDRGENLSSVLQAICDDPQQKRTILSWIRNLTPMEVRDFDFVYDQIGRVLVTFIEADGRRTSAYSASDGTLRFLAILAAVFGPEPSKLYFIEEIENGIHPTRLGQLIELIERVAAGRGIQVVATTHAPYLLGYLSRESLEHASLVYRTDGRPDARIVRIADMPNAMELIEKKDIAYMHASGWFENVASFMDDEEGEG
jgi:predicted ATPase